MKKKNNRFRSFEYKVWQHWERDGRHNLPWRKTKNPYRILVSEIMLQQTQVDRVVPYYRNFLRHFPTSRALAHAPLRDVLKIWSGLGYNRRAKFLHECAKTIVQQHNGRMPRTYEELRALPGVGEYTAGAVLAFAYDKPAVLLETNIRTALLYELFSEEDMVPDSELKPVLAQLVASVESPRLWYWALMDYGAYIKKTQGNHSLRSKHHIKQKPFKGSLREVRGAIIRQLTHSPQTTTSLVKQTAFSKERVEKALGALKHESMIKKKGRTWSVI